MNRRTFLASIGIAPAATKAKPHTPLPTCEELLASLRQAFPDYYRYEDLAVHSDGTDKINHQELAESIEGTLRDAWLELEQ